MLEFSNFRIFDQKVCLNFFGKGKNDTCKIPSAIQIRDLEICCFGKEKGYEIILN